MSNGEIIVALISTIGLLVTAGMGFILSGVSDSVKAVSKSVEGVSTRVGKIEEALINKALTRS